MEGANLETKPAAAMRGKKTRTLIIRRSQPAGLAPWRTHAANGQTHSLFLLTETKSKKQVVVARKPRPGEELTGPVSNIGSPVRAKVPSSPPFSSSSMRASSPLTRRVPRVFGEMPMADLLRGPSSDQWSSLRKSTPRSFRTLLGIEAWAPPPMRFCRQNPTHPSQCPRQSSAVIPPLQTLTQSATGIWGAFEQEYLRLMRRLKRSGCVLSRSSRKWHRRSASTMGKMARSWQGGKSANKTGRGCSGDWRTKWARTLRRC